MWAVCLLLAAAVSWVVAEDSEVAEKFGAELDIVELADRLGFYSFIEAARETGLTDTLRNTSMYSLEFLHMYFIEPNYATVSEEIDESRERSWTMWHPHVTWFCTVLYTTKRGAARRG